MAQRDGCDTILRIASKDENTQTADKMSTNSACFRSIMSIDYQFFLNVLEV